MISGILFFATLLTVAGLLFRTRAQMYNPNRSLNFKWIVKPALILLIGIFVSIFQPWVLDRVDMGNIGLKVNLTGDARGLSDYKYKTGWVSVNSWAETLYEYPTSQRHVDYEPQDVITKGGFPATIKPTFNYALKVENIGDMFQNLKNPIEVIEKSWLKTAVIGAINDVANAWPVDSIFNHREQFEASIMKEANRRCGKWFALSQLRTNIVPPDPLKNAIINKTKAIQDAQAAMQQALVATALAQEKIAIARGDSAEAVITASGKARANVIEADGEAQAMKLKQKELSPLYVDYTRALNWNGILPTTMLGNSQALFNVK